MKCYLIKASSGFNGCEYEEVREVENLTDEVEQEIKEEIADILWEDYGYIHIEQSNLDTEEEINNYREYDYWGWLSFEFTEI